MNTVNPTDFQFSAGTFTIPPFNPKPTVADVISQFLKLTHEEQKRVLTAATAIHEPA